MFFRLENSVVLVINRFNGQGLFIFLRIDALNIYIPLIFLNQKPTFLEA